MEWIPHPDGIAMYQCGAACQKASRDKVLAFFNSQPRCVVMEAIQAFGSTPLSLQVSIIEATVARHLIARMRSLCPIPSLNLRILYSRDSHIRPCGRI